MAIYQIICFLKHGNLFLDSTPDNHTSIAISPLKEPFKGNLGLPICIPFLSSTDCLSRLGCRGDCLCEASPERSILDPREKIAKVETDSKGPVVRYGRVEYSI